MRTIYYVEEIYRDNNNYEASRNWDGDVYYENRAEAQEVVDVLMMDRQACIDRSVTWSSREVLKKAHLSDDLVGGTNDWPNSPNLNQYYVGEAELR